MTLHERKCWDCGTHSLHSGNVIPEVLCKKCGSRDTRPTKRELTHNKAIDDPLSKAEQADLFNQMAKWLKQNSGIVREKMFFASEMENIFRMMATIRHLNAVVGAGDTAIAQLEQRAEAVERELEELKQSNWNQLSDAEKHRSIRMSQ